MSARSRRNGSRKHTGGITRAGGHARHYAGRHATAGAKPARKGVGKAVPAAALAATLAAGAAAYGVTASAQPRAAELSSAVSKPMFLNAFTHADVGAADLAASMLLTPRPMAGTPSGRPPAQLAPAATAQPSAAKPAVATKPSHPRTAAPSPSVKATPSATASTVSCSDNSYLLPANVTAIVGFLLANGYSHNAAAGIAGNIYQESKGDPESVGTGGGGLIGWTPLHSGFVTGDPSADLRTQLAAILTYNNVWSGYLPTLNSAATPADAAYIYVTDFERAGIPAAGTRESSADAVASACGL